MLKTKLCFDEKKNHIVSRDEPIGFKFWSIGKICLTGFAPLRKLLHMLNSYLDQVAKIYTCLTQKTFWT